MSKIIRLPKSLISKTAAGEIVSSPANVVKELIENSIDAGATKISIKIINSGLDLIEVSDNGSGMDEYDLNIAFESHTTSKISTFEDLLTTKTLGFRGEALSAITSVSTTTINSSDNNDGRGWKIIVDCGEKKFSSKINATKGTVVKVEDLFRNIPARKKYYSTIKTASKQIYNIIVEYALIYPEIKFLFWNNNKMSVKTKGVSLKKTLLELNPNLSEQKLIEVNYKNAVLYIRGYIGTPEIATQYQNIKIMSINRRLIKNRELENTIKGSFGSLMDVKSEPLYILDISLDTTKVDINVHPTKAVVLIQDLRDVLGNLDATIKSALNKHNLTFGLPKLESYKSPDKNLFYKLKDSIQKEKQLLNQKDPVLQLADLYIVYTKGDHLILLDQHAAHEKILFEKLKDNLSKFQGKKVNHLLNVTEGEKLVIKEFLDELYKAGISIDTIGNNEIYIKEIPEYIQNKDLDIFVRELLKDLETLGKVRDLPSRTEKTLSYLACRSAIKAGEKLTEEEMKSLIIKIENSAQPIYTCPHGRPLKYELSIAEIAKIFKRN